MSDSVEVKTRVLGTRPYILIELNSDDTVDVEAGGATHRQYVQMARTAVRLARRSRP